MLIIFLCFPQITMQAMGLISPLLTTLGFRIELFLFVRLEVHS